MIGCSQKLKQFIKLDRYFSGKFVKTISEKYNNKTVKFANGGDRNTDTTAEIEFCNENNVELLFGIGGDYKSNSSSWILNKWMDKN